MHDVPALRAFVHVVAVDPVNMAIVLVIGVVAVRKRDVTTAFTMGVLVIGVRGVLSRVRHGGAPSWVR